VSRIIAGAAGGSSLASVPGTATRPTSDRVKEALFSRLESYDVMAGARVLDLYAGSGALGVESASRGADSVDLVEASDKAAAVCRRNADAVNRVLGRRVVSVHRSRVRTFLADPPLPGPWDLVFLDPPYNVSDADLGEVLGALTNGVQGTRHLAAGAVVVVERSTRSPEPRWPAGLRRFGDRRYGETRLWFAEPDDDAPGQDATD